MRGKRKRRYGHSLEKLLEVYKHEIARLRYQTDIHTDIEFEKNFLNNGQTRIQISTKITNLVFTQRNIVNNDELKYENLIRHILEAYEKSSMNLIREKLEKSIGIGFEYRSCTENEVKHAHKAATPDLGTDDVLPGGAPEGCDQQGST